MPTLSWFFSSSFQRFPKFRFTTRHLGLDVIVSWMKSPRSTKPLKLLCPLISTQQTNCRYRHACCHVVSIHRDVTASHVLKTIHHNYFRQLLNYFQSERICELNKLCPCSQCCCLSSENSRSQSCGRMYRCDCRIKSLICFAHPWLQFTRAEQENKHSRVSLIRLDVWRWQIKI